MAFLRNHALVMETPDDPAYENKPSDWNAALVASGADVGGIPYFTSATAEVTSTKLLFNRAAGEGLVLALDTAITDVAAFSITRINNNAAVATGVKWTFTDTLSAAGFLPFQILSGAAGTTLLFSIGKAGELIASGNSAINGVLGVGNILYSNVNVWRMTDASGLRLSSALLAGWTGDGESNSALDTAFSRGIAGQVLVGTGAAGSFAGSLKFTNFEAVGTLKVRGLSTLVDGADGTNTSAYKFVSFVSNSAEAGNVIRVAQTSAVVFTTSSDERLKVVLGNADRNAASNRIMAHRMRNFEWKSSPGINVIGPIAQETYGIDSNPMLVQRGGRDVTKSPWTVNMSGFVPDLIMTVQELDARLRKLEE